MPFSRRQKELEEEIESHLRLAAEDHKERGKSDDEAYAAATREFGNIPLIKDVTHSMWRWNRIESILQDFRYAFRQLKSDPAFTFTIVITMALGLGATSAMYTVVDRVLLRALPYAHADRLVDIKEEGNKGLVDTGAAYLDIKQWEERSHSLESIAFYNSNSHFGHLMYLEGPRGVLQVETPVVSASLFPMLGVLPLLGRGFEQQDEVGAVRAEDKDAVVLSADVWRTQFGNDLAILGKTIKLNGESKQVVGVMPVGFTFPFGETNPTVWTPAVLGKEEALRSGFSAPRYLVLARLKTDAAIGPLQAELRAIQAVIAGQYTDPYEHDQVTSVQVQPYSDSLTKASLRTSLLALFGAAGTLWLIACVNATSLTLARGTVRLGEIALRIALGASRLRIIQQLLIESLVLSLAASLVGLALGTIMLQLVRHEVTTQFATLSNLDPDVRVIVFLFALTIVTGMLASIWPAVATIQISKSSALRQGGMQSSARKGDIRARSVLMVVELAMSLMLLTGCGLLLRTMYALRHVPLGFQTEHVIIANMAIPAYKYSGKDMTRALYLPLLEKVTQLKGVQSATLMTEVPLGQTFRMNFSFQVDGKTAADIRKRELKSQLRVVGPNAQKVFEFRMWKGRYFNDSDTATSLPVVVVNRAFAKLYTGNYDHPEEIMGESVLPFGQQKRAVVIGILEDTRQRSVAELPEPEIQASLQQLGPTSLLYRPAESMAMDLAVRTVRDARAVTPELRRLLQAASPELASSSFTTMEDVVASSIGNQRLAAQLLQIFAETALVLSVTGVYGLLAYLLGRRRKELAIRSALGAQRDHLLWLILKQAAWMLAVGVSLGLALAYGSTLLLRSFLYDVAAHDPWTAAWASFILFVSGMIAAYVPAFRASKAEPLLALRME